MVFKLVRVDSAEPAKIKLSNGTHLFGRGVLLDCNDKRVSRTHGQLEVTDECIYLKALHQNPCFIKKKQTNQMNILNKDSREPLNNGDSFGLLPDSYWYEVILALIDDNNIEENCNGNGVLNQHNSTVQEKNVSREIAEPDNFSCSDDELINFQLDEEVEERAGSPCLLDKTDSHSNQLVTNNDTEPNELVPNETLRQANLCKEMEITDENELVSVKREFESDDFEEAPASKLLKLNKDSNISDPTASTSNNQQDPTIKTEPKDEPADNNPPVMPPSPQKPSAQPQPALRERCMYGPGCYRKNLQHKADFSHPSDPDWGTDPQAPCPYGVNCQKRDPRHWRDHTHPPGTTQPGPARFGPGQFSSGPSGPAMSQMGPDGPRVVRRHGNTFYINAHTVNFYEDHFSVEDSDGDSVDYDYEF